MRATAMISGSGARIVQVEDCVIPNTDAAVGRMDRKFGVRREESPIQPMKIALAPIVVNVCQNGNPWPDCNTESAPPPPPINCEFDCDPLRYTTGGGNGSPEDPTSDPEPLPEDNRPDCQKDAQGYCVTRPVRQDEWDDLGRVIESLREDIHECREAKTILQDFYAQGLEGGRFRFWDGKDLNAARTSQRYGFMSSDARGRIIVYDSYYAVSDKGTVVHEALHVYLNNINSPINGEENELWVKQWQKTCQE